MGSYLAIAYIVQNILFSSVRWPFLSDIYEIAQAPYLVRAVVGAILRPRSAKFKVTSKDETVTTTRLTDVHRPLMFLFFLMLAGIGALAWRWNAYPGDRAVLQIVGAWVVFNTVLVGASLRSLVEQRQRRAAPRVQRVDCPAVAEFVDENGDAVEVPCVIADISYRGLRVAIPPRALARELRRPTVGEAFRIVPAPAAGVEDAGAIACKVTNCGTADGRLVVGAAFDEGQDRQAYLTIAAILNGDSRRWQAIRASQTATRRGLIWGVIFATRLALSGIYHTLAALVSANGPSLSGPRVSEAEAGWSAETPIEAQAFIAARGGQSFAPRKPKPVVATEIRRRATKPEPVVAPAEEQMRSA